MNKPLNEAEQIDNLSEVPEFATSVDKEDLGMFLDHVPIALAVSDLRSDEVIVYANPEFERISGLSIAEIERKDWDHLRGRVIAEPADVSLVAAIAEGRDRIGTFRLRSLDAEATFLDIHANVIEDDAGHPCYRLVAFVRPSDPASDREKLEKQLREKDTLLRELQHRVKNNLQMITALIRMETREVRAEDTARFERLAGRVGSLAILYDTLSLDGRTESVDLGVYLGQIATSLMASHAVEGIRLDMKVDAYPVPVDVAMPTGLVVNELMTNALKHAFKGRDGGTVTLHCLVGGKGCMITVADDGIGLPEGESWPRTGKLGSFIAQSLRENARANLEVTSVPGGGTTVTITFGGTA